MKESKSGFRKVVVEGILIPSQWNSKHEVTSIMVSAPGENEYFIDRGNQIGKELFNFLSRKVRLEGNLRNLKTDHQSLEVIRYEIIDW